MTTPDTLTSADTGESTIYRISFSRLAELKRSAVAILAARRGPMCPSLLRPEHELDDAQELLDEISEYCSPEQGFIRSDMPIQEIMFRVLLTRGNQGMSLADLHYELTENWSTPIRPINLTMEGLRRILNSDTYYGFDYERD